MKKNFIEKSVKKFGYIKIKWYFCNVKNNRKFNSLKVRNICV